MRSLRFLKSLLRVLGISALTIWLHALRDIVESPLGQFIARKWRELRLRWYGFSFRVRRISPVIADAILRKHGLLEESDNTGTGNYTGEDK